MKRLYPATAYNLVSLLGMSAALFAVAAIIIIYLLDVFTGHANPYLGIWMFLVFPGVLVVGLLAIPLGMWRERRRLKRGGRELLVIDLGISSHRNALITFIASTCVFLLLTTIGLYKGYHYTESVEFCGKICHQVMEPEYTAYFNSAHAKVTCVQCHIGPGADWYVKSKISGARQVFKATLGTYERPIPTPVRDLRPAQEVCERCHWPEKFFEATQVVNEYFLGDKENTRWRINMLVNVGGASSLRGESSGIHWHVAETSVMTYVAVDSSRQEFSKVSWKRDGKEVVYTAGGREMPESALAKARVLGLERTMDCIDCHNRPAHRFLSPMKAVNEALVSGELDPGTPWIKRAAVRALSTEYETNEGARDSIATALQDFYRQEGVDLPPKAVTAVQNIYARHMFPRMGVRWDKYPYNESHFFFPGCFRCHGSDLQTKEGKTISADCNLCHTIIDQGPVNSLEFSFASQGLSFQHPLDVDGAEAKMKCYECHIGDESIYLKDRLGAEVSGLSHGSKR